MGSVGPVAPSSPTGVLVLCGPPPSARMAWPGYAMRIVYAHGRAVDEVRGFWSGGNAGEAAPTIFFC